jgi:hypothetical protein
VSRTFRSITSIRNEAAMREEEALSVTAGKNAAPIVEPSKRARKIAFFRRRFAEIRERRKFRRRVF